MTNVCGNIWRLMPAYWHRKNPFHSRLLALLGGRNSRPDGERVVAHRDACDKLPHDLLALLDR